ncbi:MAG TPA: hypothetical protein PLT25_12825, partial [Acidocella sp.]|nr:hypothetical protein [Acidocella sp.]
SICFIMVSRRPDAILHPQFWAEDGQVFYHDAYTFGLSSLWLPLGGYLNTLSRLTALIVQPFPLLYVPALFAGCAAFFQVLPVIIMLSRRMDAVIPSMPARLAICYFYALLPNSSELNLNLTNAQWHLALAAFLTLISLPADHKSDGKFDRALLALSGLSGPFGLVLTPLAWLGYIRSRAGLLHALILTFVTAVQIGVILTHHAVGSRVLTPLGASPLRLMEIIQNQIVLGGLIGALLMKVYQNAIPFLWFAIGDIFITATAVAIGLIAFRQGSWVYRQSVLLAIALLAAALVSPVASTSQPQWQAMTYSGDAMRYFSTPTLVWFTTALVCLGSTAKYLKVAGMVILVSAFVGGFFSFQYPPFQPTGFSAEAVQFETAAAGTVWVFPENPPGWAMTLVKH